MQAFLAGFAILAGLLNSTQSGMNGALGRSLGSPILSALVSLAVSAGSVLVASLVVGGLHWPGAERVAQTPWWAWFAGVCGAVVLTSQPVVAPRLGAAVFMALLVSASVVASVLFDHFGLLGFQQHAAGLGRIAGAVLMIAGVALVAAF